MEKKFKWPKFLTFKRTLLLVILLAVIVVVLTYFLGGYKASAATSDTMPFSEEGFKTYEKYLEETLVEVNQYNNNFKTQVNSIDESNYETLIPELTQKIKTKNNKDALMSKVNALRTSDVIDLAAQTAFRNEINKVTFYNGDKDGADSTYAKELLDTFELMFKNDNYAFYFNKRLTTFRLDAIVSGDTTQVINTWYSNPQNDGVDPKAQPSTINQQKSPFILKYLNISGAIKQYNAFDYAINDSIGNGTEKEDVTPSFSLKIDEENQKLQVYYTFSTKGISYAYFPQYLYYSRIEELAQRNKEYIDEKISELKKLYEDGDIEELREYINAHMNVQITMDYSKGPSSKSYVGLEAYNLSKHAIGIATANNYAEKIDAFHNDIEVLYDIATLMLKVECQYDYDSKQDEQVRDDASRVYIKDDVYLKSYYNTTEEVPGATYIDSEGNEQTDIKIGIGNYKSLAKIARQNLYQIFYSRLQYTEDDLELDLSEHGTENELTTAVFKFAVEYYIAENGISVTVINNSIYESNPTYYPLYQIDILPYFTSAANEVTIEDETYQTNGYMIIPDGSGAVISLNNDKTAYSQYSKRIYSTDLAFGSQVKQSEVNDVLLPMYGFTMNRLVDSSSNVVQNANAIIARASKGSSQCSINSNISMVTDSYNKTYMSTTYRESQIVTIGTGYYAKDITKYTTDYVKVDTTIDYYFYSSKTKDFNYSDIAKEYQKILIDAGILNTEKTDNTDKLVFNAELIGIYNYTTNFLGIVYDGYDTLTTFDEAQTILKTLKEWGVEDINLLYRGWRDKGLINETFKDMSFGNRLGSKASYKSLLSYLAEEDITLYPITSFIEINKYNEAYGKNRYSTRDVSSEYTVKYPYDLAGNVYDKTANAIYTLSPRFYAKFSDILVKRFAKANPQLNSMAFEKLGGKIVGDYKKRNIFYRYNSVIEQINAFETFNDGGIENITLNAPYEYAIKYATNITNLPYESTLYEVFDYSIPFYQLVFSGYKDYSGLVINENDEKGLMLHLLYIFQTGSNVHFRFTYDNSSELIQTDYNYYYYTQYSQWEKEVRGVLEEINKYELHKYVLNEYEQYPGLSNVFVSTYKEKSAALANVDTSNQFSFYLNLSDKEATIVDKNGDTHTITKWNYYCDKEV